MKPDVQIIISTYKQNPEHLRECVLSAISQSHKGCLVTLRADGEGSCDNGTLVWLRELSRNMANFRFEDSLSHLGIYESYNKLIKKTRLPFVLQLDADDKLDPFAVEILRDSLLQKPNATFAFANCIDMAADCKPLRERRPPDCFTNPLALLVEFYSYHPRLIRRDALMRAGYYDTSFKLVSDYDLCLKLNEIGTIEYIDLPLYFYRVHEQSASQQNLNAVYDESLLAAQNALKRRKLEIEYEITADSNGCLTLIHRLHAHRGKDIFYIAPSEMHWA